MQFVVEPEIFERFPGMRLAVVVAHGLDNAVEDPRISAAWWEAWTEAGREGAVHGNAQSHPRVKPWRERLRALGVSPKEFPSSIEAVLRRALKGGEPFSINPLVDFYNAVSLRHTVPAGGFDLKEIRGPLELRRTRGGDTFLAMDAENVLAVPPGDLRHLQTFRLMRGGLRAGGVVELPGGGTVLGVFDDPALEIADAELPDVILLDVMMPGEDGYHLCRYLRQSPLTQHVPIMIMTAHAEDIYQRISRDVGASQHITKPFHPLDLAEKVKALLNAKKIEN